MDEDVIYKLFLFIVIPLLLTLLFADKKSKAVFGFLVLGIFLCLLASELNAVIMAAIGRDFFYYSTTVSPIVEELLKAVPLIFTVFFVMDDPDIRACISLGLAVGIGFSIFENIVLYFQNGADETLLWAFARGIGAGVMHGLCGGGMGFGTCYIRKFGKNYLFGLTGIFSAIVIYHGFYNLLVQSDRFRVCGVALPLVTSLVLIPINRAYYRKTEGR